MDTWKFNSWLFQQEMFKMLGDRSWDGLGRDEVNLSQKLVGVYSVSFGADYHKNDYIKKITDKIDLECKHFFKECFDRFSCTFINWRNESENEEGIYFVIWLSNSSGTEICIDINGRNYSSWDDFLDTNILPKCVIMFPKNGKYSRGINFRDDFIDVVFQESKACSFSSCAKNVLEIASSIVGAAAFGILLFNPVSGVVLIGATVAAVITGGYSAGNSLCRLVDIHKHEGGLKVNTKTLLATGEFAISVAGTAAVGIAGSLKGISSGTILSKGSLGFRMANNLGRIAKVCSCFNAGFSFLTVIVNYKKEGELSNQAVAHLVKAIAFSFNIITSIEVVKEVIQYLASCFKIDRILEFCMRSKKYCFTFVKGIKKYSSKNDLHCLINIIFPYSKLFIEKISNICTLITSTSHVVDNIFLELKSSKFDSKFIYKLMTDMSNLYAEVLNYKEKSKREILSKFGQETQELVDNWTQNVPIDLPEISNSNCKNSISQYDLKINTPIDIKRKISETIRICCVHIDSDDLLAQRENHLYLVILELIKHYTIKDNEDVMNKINFYCNFFSCLHSKLMELYHFEYFLFQNTCSDMQKKDFFNNYYKILDIHDSVYYTAVELLNRNMQKFHDNFNLKYTSDSLSDGKKRKIYEFSMPSVAHKLNEQDFYDKAKELIPNLRPKLNPEHTKFDNLDIIAIIKSNNDDFALFFYIIFGENHAKGILLFIDNICLTS